MKTKYLNRNENGMHRYYCFYLPMAYPMIFSLVIKDSGNITVERPMSIQSLITPATRTVTAPVLPITRNTAKFRASAQSALEKNIQKLNWKCEASILGFSNINQGTNKKKKLQNTRTSCNII